MKRQVWVMLALVGGVACTRHEQMRTGDAGTTGAVVVGRTAVTARARLADAGPSANANVEADAGVTANADANVEVLPAWVPEAGRLTVVQAPDLARNLGIVEAGGAADAAP